MKKLGTFLSRYRLITSALALAFMLTALTFSTPPASAFVCNEGMICGQGVLIGIRPTDAWSVSIVVRVVTTIRVPLNRTGHAS